MKQARQAVILIHGIGEQAPMANLRGFVDAVLDQGDSGSLVDAKYYSKPDMIADNLELRRLVSAGGRNRRTDFYEFYWAHLMPTATWDRLASWYWVLMARAPQHVPAQIMPLYAGSWIGLIVVLGFAVVQMGQFMAGEPIAASPLDRAPWLALAIVAALSALFRSYVGDAAVYLSPRPPNIEARQKIRASGLALVEKVVQSGRYDRVVIVGHSLGSVIGYDVLTFAWQRHCDRLRDHMSAAWRRGDFPPRETKAMRAAEHLAKAIRDTPNPTPDQMARFAADWRRASGLVDMEQRANGDGWLITDFVTLGSPLAHGALLLARDRADFERRARERELPHCPPVRELTGRFSFRHRDIDNKGRPQNAWVLNDAAVFAVTGWTNLYFPCRFVLKGDIVGGPVAPLFWPGVRDIAVATRTWGGWLAHTRYWQRNPADTDPATAPVTRLRAVLNLNGQSPWPPPPC